MPLSFDQVLGLPEIRVEVQNSTFPLAPFSDDEFRKWNASYTDHWLDYNSQIRSIYQHRSDILLAGARAAKKSLKDKTFSGFSAANTEVGQSFIRPGHVGFTSNAGNGKPNNIWRFTFPGGAMQNWLGSGTTNSATGFTMGQNLFITHIGVLELSPKPVADVLKYDIGRSSLVPYDTHTLRVADTAGNNSLFVIPSPSTFWPPSEQVTVRVFSDQGGTAELVPLGYTYGLGATLTAGTDFQYTEANRSN